MKKRKLKVARPLEEPKPEPWLPSLLVSIDTSLSDAGKETEGDSVQWLRRDPVLGCDRLSIKVDYARREYFVFDKPGGIIELQYMDDRFDTVTYQVGCNTSGKPVVCTCPSSNASRQYQCKHVRALTAALPKRLAPIDF